MVADPMDELDENTCPRCGEPWSWDGDTEASRVCASCRSEDAEQYADFQRTLDHSSEEPPRAA